MAAALSQEITENGLSQGDLVKLLNNIILVVNELQADHATFKTMTDELNVDGDAVFVDLTAIRAAIVGITAKLDNDGGITDTNYAATWDPNALTATAIAAADPATLTNITALKTTAG